MSICTRTGDAGTTAMMYGRRVSKTHQRVETYGTVDELNSSLGLARALSPDRGVVERLLEIQRNLVALMGELAVAPEDEERYRTSSYPKLREEMLFALDKAVMEIEAQEITFTGWATPGDSAASAALDVARTVCRRAERLVVKESESAVLKCEQEPFTHNNPQGELEDAQVSPPMEHRFALIIRYLNRLSDLLWLLARYTETKYPTALRDVDKISI